MRKGKFSNSWSIAKSSWRLLKKDPELLWLPVMSALVVLAIGAFALVALVIGQDPATEEYSAGQMVAVGIFVILCTISSVFFQGALCAGAYDRMSGGDPTVRSSLSHAYARFPSLMGWAIISAAVAILVNGIASRSKAIGRFVARLLEGAWGVVSYLVIPAIIVGGLGSTKALRKSASLLRSTWGENLISQVGLSALTMAVLIPPALIAVASAVMLPAPAAFVIIAMCVIAAVVGLIVVSALAMYYRTALYVYSETETETGGFSKNELTSAFAPQT